MKPELIEAIKSQISDFPCCKNIDPTDMTKAQDLVHALMTHLYCGGESFDLAQAIKVWRTEDFQAFLNLIGELKYQVDENKKLTLV